MKAKAILIFVVLFSACALAQERPPQPPHPGDDPIKENLFPPDLVMRHRQAIGLTAAQSEFIKEEVQKSQGQFTDLQWQMMSEQEALASLLKQDHADEAQVLAELDKVLNLERAIKRAQLALVIRIKNKLTPEQQAKLRDLRRPEPPMPPR